MGKFIDAFKYPFINFASFWNFYWMFVPFIGPFIFYGYMVAMMRSIYAGNEKQGLPRFRDQAFGDLLLRGVFFWLGNLIVTVGFYLIIIILFIIALILSKTVEKTVGISIMIVLGVLAFIFLWLATTMLTFQYADSLKFLDLINIFKSMRIVVHNLGSYIMAMLRAAVLAVIHTLVIIALTLLGSVTIGEVTGVLVLLFFIIVQMPFVIFSGTYVFAQFYRECVLRQSRSKKVRAASRIKRKK